MAEELQNQDPIATPPEGVQPEQGQGTPPEQTQPPLDYEKAYRNLEPEFTRKSQELKTLEGWKKFQEQSGISPEQALQQLGVYDQPQYQDPQLTQPQNLPYQSANPTTYDPYNQYADSNGTQFQSYPQYQQQPTYADPRISQMEQQLNEMRRNEQANKLRQKFPQFDEVYPDVINLADQQGLDLDTAFGRVLVDKGPELINKAQQQAVNTIRQKGMKDLEPSGSTGDVLDPNANLTQEELEAAQAFGIDPKDYAAAKQGFTIQD